MKLTKQKAIEIVEIFLRDRIGLEAWYAEVAPYLKAIVLYGSVSKGTNRADSDIDLLFILPLPIEEKFTKGEYVYDFMGYEINIVMRSIEGLRKIAEGPHDSFQAEVFRESEIIWQRDDEAKKLINNILHQSLI